MITEHSAPDRQHRVRFKRAVRVVPLQSGPPRAFRVLSGNLSKQGMFLSMTEPFTEGTQLALSLEAGGRVLPFAQAEVVWRVLGEGHHPGFGVRFTEFLHPRAHDLVRYLVDNLDRGVPLPTPRVSHRARLAIAACLALVAGAGLTAGGWVLFEAGQPVAPEPTQAAVAPAVPTEVELAPVAAVAEAAPEPAAAELPQSPITQATPVSAAVPAQPSAPTGPSSSGQMPLPRSALGHLAWQQRGGTLTIDLDPVNGAKWSSVFMLRSPSRLVVDLNGPSPAKSFVLPPSGMPHLKGVRLGRLGKTGTRLVFDFEQAPTSFSQSGSTLQLQF